MRYLGITLTHLMAAVMGAFVVLICLAVAMHGAHEIALPNGHSVMCIPLSD